MRLYLRAADRRPDPPPMRTDDLTTWMIGTGIWAVILVVALLLRSRLGDAGHGWWLWTAAAGVGIGLVGVATLARRNAAARSTMS